jgi:TetR/AcrR family transcriptional regulator, tetracycline repressor protein
MACGRLSALPASITSSGRLTAGAVIGSQVERECSPLTQAAVPVPEPGSSRDPITALADLMTATYAVLTAHPNLVPLYLARQGARGPHAVRLGAVMDALLSRAGVSPVNATEARRVLIVHTIGFAAFAGAPTEPDTRPLSFDSSQRTFDRSLLWLLAGITQTAGDSEPNQQSRRPQE